LPGVLPQNVVSETSYQPSLPTSWLVVSIYGVACGDCPEDLDGSGVVDIDDLLQLLSVYGTDC